MVSYSTLAGRVSREFASGKIIFAGWPEILARFRRASARPNPCKTGGYLVVAGALTEMQKLALIAAFGAIGAVARYLTNVSCIRLFGERFAFGTLVVNIVGCFLIGFLMYLSVHHPRVMSEGTHAALSTGFLGALTTFSTFGYETLHYLETDRPMMAGLNVATNLSLGLLAAWCGAQLGRMLG